MATHIHTFDVYYNDDPTYIRWLFNKESDPGTCNVKVNDKIKFSFHFTGSPPALVYKKGVLLTSAVNPIVNDWPFADHDDVLRLDKDKTLTVGEMAGAWPFSITFSVMSPNKKITSRFVPDPELQVSTTG